MFLRTRTSRDPKNVQRYNKFVRFANKSGFFLLFLLKGDVFLHFHPSLLPPKSPFSPPKISSFPPCNRLNFLTTRALPVLGDSFYGDSGDSGDSGLVNTYTRVGIY